MAFRLEVTKLVKHEARLVQRLLARLGHIGLIEVQVHELLDEDQHKLRVLHQVRWRHQEHSFGLFRVPHRRQDDGGHALSHRLRLPSLIQETSRGVVQVAWDKFSVLTLHHLHENTVTDDFASRDGILDELTTIQGQLVPLRELEVKRLQEHAGMRVKQTQSQVGDIVRELPIKVVARPAFSHNCVFVLKVFPEVVCQLGIIERIPLCLSTNETVSLSEVLRETDTETTRERQSAQVSVL